MSTTLKQTRDYIRAFYGLDATEFNDTLLNKFINLAQPNIQIDLIKNGIGYDNYIKTTKLAFVTLYGVTSSSSSQVLNIGTPSPHGYGVGDFILWGKDAATDAHPEFAGEYLVSIINTATNFGFPLNVIDSFWGAGWVTKGFVALPTDMLNVDDAIIDINVKFRVWDTINSEWRPNDIYFKPATKKTIDEGIDTNPLNTNANAYLKPDVTQPYYWIDGDSTGARVLHIRPGNVDEVRIKYRYKPTDLSADGDLVTIPDEFTDLIRLWVKRLIDEKKKDYAERTQAINGYKDSLTDIMNKYSSGKEVAEVEKKKTEYK